MSTYAMSRHLLTISGDADGNPRAPQIGLSSYRVDLLKALAPLGPSAVEVFSFNLSRQQKYFVDRVKLREKLEASYSASKGQEEKGHAALNGHHPPVSHDVRFCAPSHSPSRSRMATDGDGFYNNRNHKSIMLGCEGSEKGDAMVVGNGGESKVASTPPPHSMRSSLSKIAALAAKRDGGRVPAWARQHCADGSMLDDSLSTPASLPDVLDGSVVEGNGRCVREERAITSEISKYAGGSKYGGGGAPNKGYVYESLLKMARSSSLNPSRHPKGVIGTKITTSKTRTNSVRQQLHSLPNPIDDVVDGNRGRGASDIDNGYLGGGPSFASSHCLTNGTFAIPSSFSSSSVFESSTFLRHEAEERGHGRGGEEDPTQSPKKGTNACTRTGAVVARTRDDSKLAVVPQDPPTNSSLKYSAPVVKAYTKHAFVNNTHTAYLKSLADQYARNRKLLSSERKKAGLEDSSYSRSSSSSSSLSSFFSRIPPALHEEAKMELTKAMASYLCEENLSKIDAAQGKLSSALYPPPPSRDLHNAQCTHSKGDDAARVALAGNSSDNGRAVNGGNAAVLPLAIKRISSRERRSEKAIIRRASGRRTQDNLTNTDSGVSSRSQSTDLSVTSTTATTTTTVTTAMKRVASLHNPNSRRGDTDAYKAIDTYTGASDGGDDDEWMTLNYTQNSTHSRYGVRKNEKESPEESELYVDDMVSEDDLSEHSFRLGEERHITVARASSIPRRDYQWNSQAGKRVEESNTDIQLLTAARARRSTIGGDATSSSSSRSARRQQRTVNEPTEEQHANAGHTYSKKFSSQSGKSVVEEHHRQAVADAALSLIRERGSPRGGWGRENTTAKTVASDTQRATSASGVHKSFNATSTSRHERQVLEAIAKSHKSKATNTTDAGGSDNRKKGRSVSSSPAYINSSNKGADRDEVCNNPRASDLWSLKSQKALSLMSSTIEEDLDTDAGGMGSTAPSRHYDPESNVRGREGRGEKKLSPRRYLTPLVNKAEAASAAMSLLKTSVLPKVRKAYGDAALREEAARLKVGDALLLARLFPFAENEGNAMVFGGDEREKESASDEEDTYLSPRTWQSSFDQNSRVFSSGAAEEGDVREVRLSHNGSGGELGLSLADQARSDDLHTRQRGAPEALRRGRRRAEGQRTEGVGGARLSRTPTTSPSAYYRISVPKAVSPQRPNRGEVMARNALHAPSAHLQSPRNVNVGFGVPSSNGVLCTTRAGARKNTSSSSVGLATIGNITPIRARTDLTRAATPSRRGHNAAKTSEDTPVAQHARPSREMSFHAFKHPISVGAEASSMRRPTRAGVTSTAGGYVVAETFKV